MLYRLSGSRPSAFWGLLCGNPTQCRAVWSWSFCLPEGVHTLGGFEWHENFLTTSDGWQGGNSFKKFWIRLVAHPYLRPPSAYPVAFPQGSTFITFSLNHSFIFLHIHAYTNIRIYECMHTDNDMWVVYTFAYKNYLYIYYYVLYLHNNPNIYEHIYI